MQLGWLGNFANVPGTHVGQMGADAPTGEKEVPAVQLYGVHLISGEELNVPDGHAHDW